MKKRVLCCFMALMMIAGPTWSQGSEPVYTAQVAAVSPIGSIAPVAAPVASPMATMDLRPMPLVSRSLTELGAPEASAVTSADPASAGSSFDSYGSSRTGLGWLFEALVEPFYLSLLGASLLLFGTVKRKGG